MKRRQMIYAMVMVAIYIAAHTLSITSVLACNHDHHSDGHVCHKEHPCHHTEFTAGACDHQHTTLGDYIAAHTATNQRNDNHNIKLPSLITTPGLVAECVISVAHSTIVKIPLIVPQTEPLWTTIIEHRALRAPPTLA